MYDIKAIFVAR